MAASAAWQGDGDVSGGARHPRQEPEETPLETRLIPISYAQADELQPRAKELLSPRGSIAVDERTNVLIARDVAGNLNYIEELIRSLDTQTAQVLIEARIVEATSKYSRDVGIQWGGDVTFRRRHRQPDRRRLPVQRQRRGRQLRQQHPDGRLSPFTRNVATPNFAVNLPAAVGTGAGGALGVTLGSIDNIAEPEHCACRPRSRAAWCASSARRASWSSTTARRASTRARSSRSRR